MAIFPFCFVSFSLSNPVKFVHCFFASAGQKLLQHVPHGAGRDRPAVQCAAEPQHLARRGRELRHAGAAASVDLSTGDKGIVLIENTRDFMRPVVLRLSDNQIYDLSDKNVYQEMQVTDIMKTMDNRVAMDEETLKQFVPDEKLRQLTQEFRRKLAAGKK